jgi:uncharacterized protein YutE (UPF0331/DUF86 family)
MTFLVERLADLRRHLDHLRDIRPRVRTADDLQRDLSLHNDVLFSLLMVCQQVIDIASELAARRGIRFDDYASAIRALAQDERFSPELVAGLDRLPGFRNIVVHAYVALDMQRVVDALDRLAMVEQFLAVVRGIEDRA